MVIWLFALRLVSSQPRGVRFLVVPHALHQPISLAFANRGRPRFVPRFVVRGELGDPLTVDGSRGGQGRGIAAQTEETECATDHVSNAVYIAFQVFKEAT